MGVSLKTLRKQRVLAKKQKLLAKRQGIQGVRPSNDIAPVRRRRSGFDLSSALKETKQFFFNVLGEYSLKHENFLGVDITPHYIRLCQMDHSKGKHALTNLASACIENNFVLDDIFTNPNVYIENLTALVEKEGLKNKEVVLSVPVAGAIIRTLHIPDMTDEELQKPETLRSLWHVSLAMDIDVSEYAISIEVVSRGLRKRDESRYTPGKTMEVLLVAVRQSILAIFTHIARSAGLKPTVAVLRCFALENALAGMRKAGKGNSVANTEAFLEFGADENYLFIPSTDGVSTYEIYLAHQDRMSLAQNTMNSGSIEVLAEDYAKQIHKIIAYHQKNNPTNFISRIYVTSSLPLHMKRPGELPLINTFVGQLSGLLSNYQVSECTFCDNADISEQFTDTVNAEGKLSAWVVTMGLATSKLDAFGHLKNLARISNMNMLPEAVQLKKVERIKVISRWSGVSALTFVTALAILSYAVLYGRSEALVENISPLLQVEDKYNVEMSKLDQLRALKDRMDELNKIRGELPSNQKELLAAYNYLGESIPDGIWLKEITYEAPNAITIIGNSVDDQNILAFINSLNQSKDFGQVSLKTMQAVKEMSMNAQESLAVKKFELGGEFLPGVENGEATPAEKTSPTSVTPPATTTITTPAEKQ